MSDLQVSIEPVGPGVPDEPPRRPPRLLAILAVVALALVAGFAWERREPDGRVPLLRHDDLLLTEADQLVDRALGELRLDPNLAARVPGLWWGLAGPQAMRHSFGGADAPLPAGTYEVRLACTGASGVTVRWEVAGATGRIVDTTCDAGYSAGVFVLSWPGEVQLSVESAAVVGFALVITDPRAVAARGVLGPAADAAFETSGTAGDWQSWAFGVQPGRYRLTLVCVGTGGVLASLGNDSDRRRDDLACTPEGTTLELDIETAVGTALEVSVQALRGNPGFALRVVQGGAPH